MSIPQGMLLDTDLCTACRACELACHYHHQESFGTSAASIRIDLNSDTGDIRIRFDSSCDGCEQENRPLCVHACGPGAIQIA